MPVFNVMMPDGSKGSAPMTEELGVLVDAAVDVKQSVGSIATASAAMTVAQKRIADQTARQSEALLKSFRDLIAQQQKEIAELKRLVVADRMAILDESGMPIGSRVVTEETTH